MCEDSPRLDLKYGWSRFIGVQCHDHEAQEDHIDGLVIIERHDCKRTQLSLSSGGSINRINIALSNIQHIPLRKGALRLRLQACKHMRSVPLPARYSESTSRDRNVTHNHFGNDTSLRHALEFTRSQLRGCDVVRFYLADKVLLQRLDFDAQQSQALGDVGPGAREDVCFGARAGQVCGGWGVVAESDGNGYGGAVDMDETPGDVGLARVG